MHDNTRISTLSTAYIRLCEEILRSGDAVLLEGLESAARHPGFQRRHMQALDILREEFPTAKQLMEKSSIRLELCSHPRRVVTEKLISMGYEEKVTLLANVTETDALYADLIIVSPEEMGITARSTKLEQVCRKGLDLGLHLCHPDIGLLLALCHADQLEYCSHWVAMEPIPDPPRKPVIFTLMKDDGRLTLHQYNVDQRRCWNTYDKFIFVRELGTTS